VLIDFIVLGCSVKKIYLLGENFFVSILASLVGLHAELDAPLAESAVEVLEDLSLLGQVSLGLANLSLDILLLNVGAEHSVVLGVIPLKVSSFLVSLVGVLVDFLHLIGEQVDLVESAHLAVLKSDGIVLSLSQPVEGLLELVVSISVVFGSGVLGELSV